MIMVIIQSNNNEDGARTPIHITISPNIPNRRYYV